MRERLSRLRNEDGFTTVEVLVAAFVLALGIGSTIIVLNASGKTGSTAERHQSGVAIAQQEIEKIRALPYSQVGMSSVTWPANGKPDDPATRVTGGKFRALPGTAPLDENFVAGTDCTPNCLVAPATTAVAAGNATATIYRFVSWRDEECGLLGNGQLGLLGSISGLTSQTLTLLTQLVGATGSLQVLITAVNDSYTALNGIVSILTNLVSSLLPNLPVINQLGAALERTSHLVTDLKTLLTGLNSLVPTLQAIAGITQLDLCDMDLSSLRKLRSLSEILGDLNPLLSGIQSQVPSIADQFRQTAGLKCTNLVNCLLGTVLSSLNSVLNSVAATLNTSVPSLIDNQLKPLLTGGDAHLITDLKNLDLTGVVAGLTRNTDKNTKRVQVAVVLDPAGPTGPLAPIWMSTIVTDPTAGLLTG